MQPDIYLKNAFNPNSGDGGRYIDYNVRFEIINNDAQFNSTVTAAEDSGISLKDTVFSNSDFLKFATFEQNGFALDGSAVVPPAPAENTGNIGYLSGGLSDADGNTDITVTLETDAPANLIAVTLGWGFVYPLDFSLNYYDEDGNNIHTANITGSEQLLFQYNFGVLEVKKIIINITKISQAYSRCRLAYFLFGAIKIYDKTNSDSLDITETLDPLNERLPANELKLVCDNFAGEFNIFDPSGIYDYFNERQLIRPKIGGAAAGVLSYVQMGRYYLQKPKLSGNTSKIDIKATNIFGVLSDTVYSTGQYGQMTFKQLLNTVFEGFNLNFIYPGRFGDFTFTTFIKTQKYSDILRKIAQAANTVLFTDKAGNIVFASLADITAKHSFDYSDYKLENGFQPSDDNIINTIEVEVSNFTINPQAEKLTEISGTGTFNIKYEPSINQTAAVTGGTVTNAAFYADNAVITITGGTAVISGQKIITNKNTVTANNRRQNDGYYTYSVKDNEFINNQNAETVADYILKLKAVRRRGVKVNYRGYPYIELGDKIDYYINDSITQDFFITKNNFKCAGGMTAALESKEEPI
jgi:hypothetical protein